MNAILGRKGFTLIELLVVVLIIGILSAIALPKYEEATERARIAEAITMTKIIGRANQRYFLATGEYADHIDKLDIEIPGESVYGTGTGNRVQTKHFIYTAGDAPNRIYISIAQRVPINQRFSLFMTKTDQRIHCSLNSAPTDIQRKICAQIEANGTL